MKTSLLSGVIAVVLATASLPAAAQEPLPLSGAAYRTAEQAFAAYDRGDYATAQRQAAEAARLRPDVVRLRLLHIYALQKLGRADEARTQARRALQDGLVDPALPGLAAAPARVAPRRNSAANKTVAANGGSPRLDAAEQARQRAFALASDAYGAYDAGRMDEAADKAEQAFRQQPQQGEWALLWVAALEAQRRLEQADAAAATALQLGAPNVAELHARREALARQRALEPAQAAYAAHARQDYQEAIRQAQHAVELSPGDARLQELLTTVLAAGNAMQQAQARQRIEQALATNPHDAGLLMQRGYLHRQAGEPERALADFLAAAATGNAPSTVVLDQAYASAATDDKRRTVGLLHAAIDHADRGALQLDQTQRYNLRNASADLSREWGMVAAAGYRGARQAASNLGGAAISTPGDAVFGTLEAFWRPPALDNRHGRLEAYARIANTLYDEGGTYESVLAVDPCTGQASQDARERAERLSRSRSIAGWPSTIGSLGVRYMFGDTGISAGIERRQFLGSATRSGSIYPDSAAIQCEIQQRAAQPLQANLLARYRLGESAGGWMSYVTYGYYHGTQMRTDVNQWWTVSGYAQVGYSWDDNEARFSVDRLDGKGIPVERLLDSSGHLRREQLFAAGELRVGRSFRPGEQTRWMLTPSLVVAADWSDQRSRVRSIRYPGMEPRSFDLSDTRRSWALGMGPGVGMRYWFREDHYNAARSYLDFNVQYRFAIGGGDDQRAKGLFATATLYY